MYVRKTNNFTPHYQLNAMKPVKLLLLLFVPLMQLRAQQICKEVDNIADAERQHFDQKFNTNLRSLASNDFNVYYYRCEWKVNPAVRYLDGKVTSYFKIKDATSTIIYDFTTILVVDSVTFRNRKATFTQNATKTLTIDFGKILPVNRRDSVSIYYHGVPPSSGDFTGGFTQTTHSSTPVIWTLSEPYGASGWWPCKNGLTDKADSIDVYVSAPSQYKSTSNGTLQGETISGSYKTAHYKHRYPIASYLVAFAVTNYSTFSTSVQLGQKTLPLVYYVYPEDLSYFMANTQPVINAIKLYNTSFGKYPFINEKYGQTQFSWGGGMEHQSNSFITNAGENLVTHELAHQWFGDKVTCGSWEHIWLNEGFATFCADFWYTENTNINTYKQNVAGDLAYIVSSPGGSVWVDDTTNSSRIFDGRLTYNKGAFLLRMLRATLGDSAFFTGLRAYLEDPKLKYDFAKTEDLQRNLEQASGQDLDYFFQQWFYGQGYPSFTVNWKQKTSGKLNFTVSQTTSHPSVNFFKMPLPVVVKNGTLSKTIVLQNTSNNQSFVIDDPGFTVTEVLIDPDKNFITKNNKAIQQTLQDGDVAPQQLFSVYPNPVKDRLTVNLAATGNKAVLVQLFGGDGVMLWSKQVSAGEQSVTIPFASYHAGSYLVTVQTEDGKRSSQRVLK